MIILCLRIPQFLIEPFLLHQFFMAPSLGHPAMLKHQDLVAETAATHPVGNIKTSATLMLPSALPPTDKIL